MCNPNYLRDAIDAVVLMDVPEHLISMAIADHAKLNAGFDCESDIDTYDLWTLSPESFVAFQ
jgi:hypothetical protein